MHRFQTASRVHLSAFQHMAEVDEACWWVDDERCVDSLALPDITHTPTHTHVLVRAPQKREDI